MKAQPGRLYVLAIGINKYPKLSADAQLEFAAGDATAIANVFKAQPANAVYTGVSLGLLTDATATLSNIKIALRELKDRAGEHDSVVIFIAGHGIQDAQGIYYFPTSDVDIKNLKATALCWEDFHAVLREVRARQVLLLADTCQSAQIVGNARVNSDALVAKINADAHRLVFTATRATESSLERPDWGHGAFTKALLEALTGQADADKDGNITLHELREYVPTRVVELTKNRQHPQMPYLDQFEPDTVLGQVVAP